MNPSEIYFLALILTANGLTSNTCGCLKPKPPLCECENPVYSDQPTNIMQCYFQTKLIHQVKANFDLSHKLLVPDSKYNCDYTDYRKVLVGMEKVVIDIVDAYFKCRSCDCTSAIETAYKRYGNYLMANFFPFTLCSYTKLSPECAAKINLAAYFSADNILSTLLTCAKLKAERQLPDFRVLLASKNKTPDCNCVKMNPQPIPASEEECFSPDYTSRLRWYLADSFSQIEEVYRNASIANPECKYCELKEYTKEMKNTVMNWTTILEMCHPTFNDLKPFTEQIVDLATHLNELTCSYVLENTKSCYFAPRAIRQSILSVLNYVIQSLMKCVHYKDTINSECLTKQKRIEIEMKMLFNLFRVKGGDE